MGRTKSVQSVQGEQSNEQQLRDAYVDAPSDEEAWDALRKKDRRRIHELFDLCDKGLSITTPGRQKWTDEWRLDYQRPTTASGVPKHYILAVQDNTVSSDCFSFVAS